MSVRLMANVFELDVAASEKLVLLAMADHARDDGTGCYPAIETLARKTSQSRRGVQKIMRRLEDAGLIVPSRVSRGGPHRSTEYRLTLTNSEPHSLFASTQPARSSPVENGSKASTKPRTPGRQTANASTPNREPQDAKQRTGFARSVRNHHEPSLNLATPSPGSCGNLVSETAAAVAETPIAERATAGDQAKYQTPQPGERQRHETRQTCGQGPTVQKERGCDSAATSLRDHPTADG